MHYFQMTLPATLTGLAVVLFIGLLRLQWPFRYHYRTLFCKRNPGRMQTILESSYLKNKKRSVALLDKSSQQLLEGKYDAAESYITQAIMLCKESPTLFHRALLHHLFYNLAVACYFRGRYRDALQIAIHLYKRDPRMQNALGIIVCCQARLGDLQAATHALSLLQRRRIRPALLHFCLAEMKAAEGRYTLAVEHIGRITHYAYSHTLFLRKEELDLRINEWTKAASHAG
ncbi:hypothetical protein JNUCC42_09495 [Brevibacterium sp. JNUCC-42]|nr:hypothetical protein JNUCC42_09495 [Brevibacterium sp. JNUCC-42]